MQPVDRALPAARVAERLPVDDLRALACLPHVAEEQAVLELLERLAPEPQRRHDRARLAELDVVEAAERRGVLVLAAARELQVDALDAERQLRQLVRRQVELQPLPQHREQRHHERRRRSEARAGRRVGVRPQVGAPPDPQRPHGGFEEIERAVELHPPRVLVLRDHVVVERGERQPRVAPRVQRRVRVVVDRRRQHAAAVLLGIRRDVRPAPAERQPQRRPRAVVANRRRLGRPRSLRRLHCRGHRASSRSARSQSSGVPMSQNRPGQRRP